MKTTKIVFAITMALSFLPIQSALAGEKATDEVPGVQYKIDETTCREMLQMGGESRDFTMISSPNLSIRITAYP